jgi:hypothetical protein
LLHLDNSICPKRQKGTFIMTKSEKCLAFSVISIALAIIGFCAHEMDAVTFTTPAIEASKSSMEYGALRQWSACVDKAWEDLQLRCAYTPNGYGGTCSEAENASRAD